MAETQYPECEKWAKLLDEGGKAIINFITWLGEQNYEIAKYNDESGELNFITKTSEQLLQEYGDVDPKKLEEERQKMIASL